MQEAIERLISENKNVSPYDLIHDLLPKFYPTSDIVLDAANYFITIIKCKDICVEQDKLIKYNVITSNRSSVIKTMLEQYDLKENVDYHLHNVMQMVNRSQGGGRQPNKYTLTPKAFFLCLVRSKNSCEYAKYYFHVLELYDYYEEYYSKMYKKEITELKEETTELKNTVVLKDDKIDALMAKIDKQTEEFREMMSAQSTKLDVLQTTVDKITKKLDTCAHIPTEDELSDRFVIMKKDDQYYVIRSQERRINKAVKEQESKGFTKVNELIESETIPNSVYLWNAIKTELVKDKKISTRYNSFTLNMSESDLVTIIKEIFNSRKEYN